MLTRHSPLHAPGRAEVGGWLVGESDGLSHPDGFRTAARVSAHVSPALRHVAGADRRSIARQLSSDGDEKKSAGRSSGHAMRTAAVENRSSQTRSAQPAPSLTGLLGDSRIQTRDATVLAPSQPRSRPDRLPIESHLIILRNPQTVSKENLLDKADFFVKFDARMYWTFCPQNSSIGLDVCELRSGNPCVHRRVTRTEPRCASSRGSRRKLGAAMLRAEVDGFHSPGS